MGSRLSEIKDPKKELKGGISNINGTLVGAGVVISKKASSFLAFNMTWWPVAKDGLIAATVGLFFAWLCAIVLPRVFGLFGPRYARRHRLCGALYECVLLVGVVDMLRVLVGHVQSSGLGFGYDVMLTGCGCLVTATAWADFRRAHDAARVRNRASGTLEKDSTVTGDEMLEHLWYEGLLGIQTVFLHLIWRWDAFWVRALLLGGVTLPWLTRAWVPVHSFSANYSDPAHAKTLVGILYRVKKYQYVLYKHFLLHGLNISLALSGAQLTEDPCFRCYWVLINASYTHEFFLQTLVKKGHISQLHMLCLQKLLMLGATLSVFPLLWYYVHPVAAGMSLLLNFIHRHHDVVNTCGVAVVMTFATAFM